MPKRFAGQASPYQLIVVSPARPHLFRRTFGVSALLTLPLLGLLYLLHHLIDLPFLPADFFVWLLAQLPGLVRSFGFLVTVGASLALDVMIGNALIAGGKAALLLSFVLSGGIVGLLGALLPQDRLAKLGWLAGAGWGALWGTWLITISMTLARTDLIGNWPAGGRYGIALALFTLWGAGTGWANGRLTQLSGLDKRDFDKLSQRAAAAQPATQRRFLWQLAAGALTLTLVSGATGLQLARWRNKQRRAMAVPALTIPAFFPTTLRTRIYPTVDTTGAPLVGFRFPEFDRPRYRPETHPIGVCFSGGGAMSASASVGQMRGLHALGLLAQVGAISAVSGGSWFATIFSYAPTTISDSTLLGAVVAPDAITLDSLSILDPHYIAAPFTTFSTERLSAIKTAMMIEIGQQPNPPFNRLYARTLNEFLLTPFGLADPHKLFTLDQLAVAQIIANNPALRPADFYTMRPDRPYLIAGAAQAYPLGADQRLRAVEITPLYTGLPQYFPGEGPAGVDIGGGYVESFAFDATFDQPFDSTLVQGLPPTDLVSVATPSPLFLLSDLMGSSGAAPGELLNSFGQPEWFPEFNYWSPVQPPTADADSVAYSFVDGAALENSGIIPLLRRHYPIILAFLNSERPLGATSAFTVDGIARMVTQLFGVHPLALPTPARDPQIFPRPQFEPLQAALLRAKAEQRAPWFMDSYALIQPNAYGIPPYPGGNNGPGKVTVLWFYNDLNHDWYQQLPAAVQALFTQADPTNDLGNFPNYDIFLQNKNRSGLPQLLNLTPQQINLIAHMHCYTVMHDAGATLLGLL